MSLLYELQSTVDSRKCVVGRWQRDLASSAKAELDEAMNSTFSLAAIYQVLRKRDGDLGFSLDSFVSHFIGDRGGTSRCRCRS